MPSARQDVSSIASRTPTRLFIAATFMASLLRACEASGLIELRTSAEVIGYEQDGSNVEVMLAGGSRVRGSALVGADGLLSKTRAQMVGDGGPRVSGPHDLQICDPHRADAPKTLRWNAMTVWVGP